MTVRACRALALAAVAALACDQGLEPSTAFVGISGRITFRGAVPDSTDVVYVVAYPTFPKSRNDLLNFRPPIPPTLPLDVPAARYQLALPNGRYEWVLAVWKKQGAITLANADSLLREAGFYHDPADATRSGVVVVQDAEATRIDFDVDFANMRQVSYYFPPPGIR